MALSRIGNRADLALLFAKSLACTATACCSHQGHRAPLPRSRDAGVGLMHASVARRYPEAPPLPLPYNLSEILNIETSRFAPERARDLGGRDLLLPRAGGADGGPSPRASGRGGPLPSHRLDSYDCNGALSLSGSMQTNVPKPFRAGGRSTYLNMPGGLWARDGKYIAEVMRESHFTVYRAWSPAGRLRGEPAGPWSRNYTTGAKDTGSSQSTKGQSIDPELKLSPKYEALSKKEKLKILLKDYGRVILFFHVGISIVSLAVFYVLVSIGLDLEPIMKKVVGAENDDTKANEYLRGIVNQSSTFLIAYGVHKLFAPVRLSVTLACCPIIVRFLRRRGILEPLYKVNK